VHCRGAANAVQSNKLSLTSPIVGVFRAAMPAIVAQLTLKKYIASSAVIEGILIEAACFVMPSENSKNTVSSEGSYFGMLASSGALKFLPRPFRSEKEDAAI
jgi:hypothetical protein